MKKSKTKFKVDWHSYGAFTAYLPLPGYSRKYINVNVIDGILSVHALGTKYPAFCKKQTVASLALPEHFRMPLKIEATFDNGLLTIFVQDTSILDGKIICVKIKKDKKLKPDDLKGATIVESRRN